MMMCVVLFASAALVFHGLWALGIDVAVRAQGKGENWSFAVQCGLAALGVVGVVWSSAEILAKILLR